MSSDWITTTIGDQATLQRGFDITKAAQQIGSVPVISSGGTNSYHNVAMAKGPGVVLGRKGVVGSVYFVREDYWPHDTTLWVKDFHGNDEKFTYYFFLSRAKDLAALDVGSANPTLNRNHVHPIKVKWPSLEEQRAIGTFLATIDDRITLLRETNATLEAIAQALFKSWFVDFDPVHAKQQGRILEGIDDATATLFPDSFEKTESGLVPRGWFNGKFGNILSESTVRVGKSEVVVLSAVQTGELVRSDEHFNKRVHSSDISKYKQVPPFSFAYNPSRINIGSIGLNDHTNMGAVSPVYVVATTKDTPSAYLIWHHLRTLRVREQINTLASGTVRQNLPFSDFISIPLIIPDCKVLGVFYDLRSSLYGRINANARQIGTLASLRDTLLPRLLSGQLRLPEAETMIEQTAA